MKQHTLRIATWNANGLLQHLKEVEAFLILQNIDVLLVSETHFTKESYAKIPGYKLYYTLHPDGAARGGTAILIKAAIKHHELQKHETRQIQATSVHIIGEPDEIALTAIYCPPNTQIDQEQFETFFRSLGGKFLAGGDYNAKHTHWGSRLITTRGRALFKAANSLKLNFFSSNKPTYWPTDQQKIPDLLDFFVVKGISNNYVEIESCDDLSSDHTAVMITISPTIIKTVRQPSLTNRKTDWDLFRQKIEERINLQIPLRNQDQLDEAAEQFTKMIQEAAWKATPPNTERDIPALNFPLKVRNLVTEKRQARRKWHNTRDPADKTIFNRLSQRLKRLLSKIKNESVERYLQSLTGTKETEYSLWKATKRIKRPNIQNPPIKKENGDWARDNLSKAETFAEHLERTFHPNETDSPQDLVAEDNTDRTKIRAVSPGEVRSEIQRHMNPKKAPGYELITAKILKELPRKAIVLITYIFNAALRLKYVPQSWKIAQITMIPKPGKPNHEVLSYRPISLLPMISKLFEKLLLKRLKIIIHEKNLIPEHQFGFRDKHATIDQVHRVTNVIELAFEDKKYCPAVFLDVAQAFDRVWHEGLFFKLNRSLPHDFVLLLKSYLSGRYFRIKYEDEYSGLRPIKAGVPQGSVLGPTLYLLYTADIPKPKGAVTATFADDTAILSVSSNLTEATETLQKSVDQIKKWFERWRIKINERKSIHVIYALRKPTYQPVVLNQQIIPQKNVAKYLGMNLDAKLNWKEHIRLKRMEIKIKQKKLYWLLGRRSQLSIQNKLLLYKQIIKPIWTYGIALWGCAKKTNRKSIQTVQNQILRSIVDAPWYVRNSDIHRDLHVSTVDDEIQRLAGKHIKRLHQHPNIEVLQLLDNSNTRRRLCRVKPLELD